MNVLEIVQLLSEAASAYEELKSSGLLGDIEASIEKDKEIIAKLEANPKFKALQDKLLASVVHK